MEAPCCAARDADEIAVFWAMSRLPTRLFGCIHQLVKCIWSSPVAVSPYAEKTGMSGSTDTYSTD
jgi:hypothetical protein